MFGSSIWYLVPKFFPDRNPVWALFWAGIFLSLFSFFFGKIFFPKIAFAENFVFGFWTAVGVFLPTIFYFFAIDAGGKIAPVGIIIEFSVILATLAGVIFFAEKLHFLQILGIFIAFFGVGLVLFFEK